MSKNNKARKICGICPKCEYINCQCRAEMIKTGHIYIDGNQNQMYKDDDGKWVVELYVLTLNGRPQYSVFDSFETEKEARYYASIATPEHETKIRLMRARNPRKT